MIETTHIRVKTDQLDRIRKMKVHENQADYEIIDLLLDTYDNKESEEECQNMNYQKEKNKF